MCMTHSRHLNPGITIDETNSKAPKNIFTCREYNNTECIIIHCRSLSIDSLRFGLSDALNVFSDPFKLVV